MVQEEAHGEVVAAGGAPRDKKLNFFQRIALFIRQVFGELRKGRIERHHRVAGFPSSLSRM